MSGGPVGPSGRLRTSRLAHRRGLAIQDPLAGAPPSSGRGGDVGLKIVGGILGENVLSAEQVKELAQLPSREVLLAKVVGGIQWPLTGLVSCLAGPVRGLAYALQARINQLEEA